MQEANGVVLQLTIQERGIVSNLSAVAKRPTGIGTVVPSPSLADSADCKNEKKSCRDRHCHQAQRVSMQSGDKLSRKSIAVWA